MEGDRETLYRIQGGVMLPHASRIVEYMLRRMWLPLGIGLLGGLYLGAVWATKLAG